GSPMLKRLLLAGLLTLWAILPAASFPLKIAGIDTTRTAVWIHDLRWGYDLVNANIDRSLVPASVMKSITCASLLNLCAPDERFTTRITFTGTVTDSVLRGNLLVHAVGDPTIESRHFPEAQGFASNIAKALGSLGITRIEGDVIIDESAFPDATTPPGWMAEDIVVPYGARLHGANFHDNTFRLTLPAAKSEPRVPGLSFNYLSPKRRGVKVERKDGSETFTVIGNKRRALSTNLAIPYPAKAMRAAIVDTLDDYNIKVDGNTLTPAGDEVLLLEHHSPTFADIMRSLMHRSDNLMAEGMLRAIVPGGTRAQAVKEENAVWTFCGISPHGVNIVDGSGLSRDNRLTARFLGEVYRQMLTDEESATYVSLFPRAGYDGTLRYFLADTPLEGRVVMKTGSMKGVQSYSGYLLDEEGKPSHLLVFMANGFTCPRQALKKEIQRLLLELFDVSLQENLE
ncbi:MAG: D-alanyl-D-alanine carboxypeptidase/D-alanyl-D-alanine-endopeptidase, partial [Duncaniella sp.]|nr:D-alanyl-D-alanine carboxypeptidase/D-alanyl-D-alanine-endopeptidase [Duncaniella sp.]